MQRFGKGGVRSDLLGLAYLQAELGLTQSLLRTSRVHKSRVAVDGRRMLLLKLGAVCAPGRVVTNFAGFVPVSFG